MGTKVDVFKAVVEAVNRNEEGATNGERRTNGEGPTNAQDSQHESWLICGEPFLVDDKGMTVLHVACRRACPDIVEEIMNEVKQQNEDFVQKFLRVHDNTGRTPLMQALRDDDKGCYDGKDKVELILESLKCGPEARGSFEEKLKLLTQLTQPADGHNSTAVIHAAHGGSRRLAQVQKKIYMLAESSQDHRFSRHCRKNGGVSLDFALGIRIHEEEEGIHEEEEKTKISRYGNLLAAAASGGHCCVLQDIVAGIEVRCFSFNNTFYHFLHARRSGHPSIECPAS